LGRFWERKEGGTHPLLNPRLSIITFALTTSPAFLNSSSRFWPVTSKKRLPTYTVLLDCTPSLCAAVSPKPAAPLSVCPAVDAAAPTDSAADRAASDTDSAVDRAVSPASSVAETPSAAAVPATCSTASTSDFGGSVVSAASDEAAIELSPCWASVAPSASGSDLVAAASSARNLRCRG